MRAERGIRVNSTIAANAEGHVTFVRERGREGENERGKQAGAERRQAQANSNLSRLC